MSDDTINYILLDARRQLADLQASLAEPATSYQTILGKLNETTAKLRTEANTITSEIASESTLIPLYVPKQKYVKQKPKKRDTVPREYKPYKDTKSTQLKRKYTPRAARMKTLPAMESVDVNLTVPELISQGKIKDYDDVSNILPPIDPSIPIKSDMIYPSIKIDIEGAAAAFQAKRERALRESFAVTQPETPRKSVKKPEPEPEPEPPVEEAVVPRLYEEIQDEYAVQTLLIVRGKIERSTPDFESFQRTNGAQWEKFDSLLNRIELFCSKFGIQYAEVDGRKLSEVAFFQIIDERDVHQCLLGVDEFIARKKNAAANVIQSNVRVWLWKLSCKTRKAEFWSAYSIQQFWHRKKAKDNLLLHVHDKINSVKSRAVDLSKKDEQKDQAVKIVVHIIANMQDLCRCFDLIYSNVELILIMPSLPPGNIWEDFINLLSVCGIPNANERIHFIMLKDLPTCDGVSNRLFHDLHAVHQVRRFICQRDARLIPHFDWDAERQLSADIELPIFGVVDNSELQTRAAIKAIFTESGIVTPLSTKEYRDLHELDNATLKLKQKNPDLPRWLIRLGFHFGIGWFDNDQKMHTDVANFAKKVKEAGAMVEAVPDTIYSFPTVCLELHNNSMKVIGTFDRLHYSPFAFGANVVPCISVDGAVLVKMAKSVGATLMRKKVVGYVMVDFLSFFEDGKLRVMGYDIRLNAYPQILYSVYALGVCGFDASTGDVKILQNVNTHSQNVKRIAVVHNQLTHPGLSHVGTPELKQFAFQNGMIFDLIERMGMKIVMYDKAHAGKGFSIVVMNTGLSALSKFEEGYTKLLKFLNAKVASQSECTIAQALQSVRHFKSRIYHKK